MTIAPSLHAMASIPSSSQIGYTMSRSIISTYRVFRLSTQGGHKSCPYDLPSRPGTGPPEQLFCIFRIAEKRSRETN